MNIGTKRPMRPSAAQKLALRASIHNRFDVEVIDAQTGEVKQRARGFNVICNTLWDRLFYTSSTGFTQNYLNYVLLGSGSGTPAVTDTTLFSYLGSFALATADVSFTYDRRNGIATSQAVATLQAEQYVGATLTEVGIGYDSTHCVTHALLEDMNGNPISIEKTDLDVIKIYATIYLHWPAGGWYDGSINFGSSFSGDDFIHHILGRGTAQTIQGGLWFIGAAQRTGAFVDKSTRFMPTVNRQNKTISFTRRIAADDLNMPIRSIRLGSSSVSNASYIQLGMMWITPGSWYTPAPISAEAIGTGNGTQSGFATAFPVKDGAPIVVYINGEPVSNYTVRSGPADVSNVELWLDELSGIDAGRGALSSAGDPLYWDNSAVTETNGINLGLSPGGIQYAFQNPFPGVGISLVRVLVYNYSNRIALQVSDDCQNWVTALTADPAYGNWTDYSIPAEYRHKKYLRFSNAGSVAISGYAKLLPDVADSTHNIVFAAPPAAGAVITCDYTPDCIPKDSDHVFDISMELTLGEYQEA